MKVLRVGICGATCSGKTTLAKQLRDQFMHTIVINQDDFYLDESQLSECSNGMYNWDVPDSLNQDALLCVVQDACNQPLAMCQECVSQQVETSVSDEHDHIILIEGTMILALQKLRHCLDVAFFLTLDKTTCRQRRQERQYDGQSDPPGYFETFLWPSYLHLRDSSHVQTSGTVVLDGCQNLHDLQGLMATHINTCMAQK